MSMNNSGMIGEILETGQSTVKNVAKSATQGAQSFVNTATGQITGSQSDQGTNEQANAVKQNQKKMSDDNAKQFLKDLYGKTDKKDDADPGIKALQGGQQDSQNIAEIGLGLTPSMVQKTPEEQLEIEALRRQLHSDYYQNLVNRPKQKEESVTEKIEREDEMAKFEEFQKQKEKPDPLANVKKGTGESMVGSG